MVQGINVPVPTVGNDGKILTKFFPATVETTTGAQQKVDQAAAQAANLNLSNVNAPAGRTSLGLGAAALLAVGAVANTVASGADVRFPDLSGAAEGYVSTYDAVAGKLVLRPATSAAATGTGTVVLTTTPTGNGGVFTSIPYEKTGEFPDNTYASARLIVSANATYTAVMQGSATGVDGWADVLTYTTATSGGITTIDQTSVPPQRFTRWVITATGPNMSKMSAKVVLV